MKSAKDITLRIINPTEIAIKNLRKNHSAIALKKYQFKRIYPHCGVGLYLTFIKDNPGLHRKDITNGCNSSGQKAELFSLLVNCELIEYKKGYFITKLGKNFLDYFNIK